MSEHLDIDAIKARLAALRRADEEYVSVIANRPAMEPEYNYHLRVARREVEAHAPADIAALLAEVERLQRERAALLSVKNVTIQTPPITEAELVNAAETAMGQWQLEALRARAEVERLQRERSEWRDRADALMTEQMTQQRDLLADNAALRERLTLTPERIEAAAKKLNKLGGSLSFDDGAHPYAIFWESLAEAALLAAGMQGAEQ